MVLPLVCLSATTLPSTGSMSMTLSLFDRLAPSSRARVDCSRDDPSWVSLMLSALYSTSVPSSAVFLAVRRSFWIKPPRIIASLAFLSSIVTAAIFSRAETIGSSTIDPSRLSIRRVVPSRTMLVRTSTISATDHRFSRNAVSMSPGTKNEVRPSPPPTTMAWLSDFRRSVSIIVRGSSKIKLDFFSAGVCPSGTAVPSGAPERSPTPAPEWQRRWRAHK